MKTVPTTFDRSGWRYQQLFRSGMIAIYRRFQPEFPEHAHFEVVRIRTFKAAMIGDRALEAGESYPCTERWGTDGWTFTDEPAAYAKARSVLEKQPQPNTEAPE